MKYQLSEQIEEFISSFISLLPKNIASFWLDRDSLLYGVLFDSAKENMPHIVEILDVVNLPNLVFARKKRGDSLHLRVNQNKKSDNHVYYDHSDNTVLLSTDFFSRHHPEHGLSSIPDRKIRFDYVFFHEFGHATTFLDNGEYLKTKNVDFNFLFSAKIEKIDDLHLYMERQLNEIYADIFSVACLCKKNELATIKGLLPGIIKDRQYVSRPWGVTAYGFEEHETARALEAMKDKLDEPTYQKLQKANLKDIQSFIGELVEEAYPAVLDSNISGFYSRKTTAIRRSKLINEGVFEDEGVEITPEGVRDLCVAVNKACMEYGGFAAMLPALKLALPQSLQVEIYKLPGDPDRVALPEILSQARLEMPIKAKLKAFRAQKDRPFVASGPG